MALFTENPEDAQIDLVPMSVCGKPVHTEIDTYLAYSVYTISCTYFVHSFVFTATYACIQSAVETYLIHVHIYIYCTGVDMRSCASCPSLGDTNVLLVIRV